MAPLDAMTIRLHLRSTKVIEVVEDLPERLVVAVVAIASVIGCGREATDKRKAGRSKGEAKQLNGTRYALWKNPEDLTANQAAKLAWVAKTNPRLHRGYLLKEGLRYVFKVKGQAGKEALDRWLAWAQRCRIPDFVEVGRKIRRHRGPIDATLEHGLSQGLIESTNTKIRVLTRMAYGFKPPEALIAPALLSLGGYRPDLPGRAAR